MSTIKRLLRGLPNLGLAIDERLRRRSLTIDIRHSTGAAGCTPSGSAGSGGGPAYPERFVSSLQRAGASAQLSGDIVLDAEGDTSLQQSASAPHFVISSPVYSGSDGVARIDNDFRADQTVLRTAGNQSISGIKTFAAFPVTPSCDPDTDYQAANKRYVDGMHAGDRQTFCAIGGNNGELVLTDVKAFAYPNNVSIPLDFMVYGTALFNLPEVGGPIALSDSYAAIEWTSLASGGVITTGARTAIAAVARRTGVTANLSARLQVNQCSRLSGIYLQLSDTLGNQAASSNLIELLSDGVWTEIYLNEINTSNWTNALHLCLTLQGTQTSANAGFTSVRFEALYLEQFPR